MSGKHDVFGNLVFPGATWIGSPNFGYPAGTHGRDGHSIQAIVVHVAEGQLSQVDEYFQERAPGGDADAAVSAHFCIGMTGTVHQYVSVADAAWGNGVLEPGHVLPPGAPVGVNPNLYTVSIEHAGFSGHPFTLAQLCASAQLINALCYTFGLKPLGGEVIRHSQLAPVTRSGCPGKTFPLQTLLELIAASQVPIAAG